YHEQAGETDRALDVARRAVAADPLREEAHGDLIRLYLATGQPSAALRQYRELERLLREELGETPSAAMRALVERLVHEAPAAPPTARRKPVTRRKTDIEPQRRRDTEDSQREPEPRTLTGYLPPQATRFFGREEEIARLTELLNTRLLTLIGPGG